MQVELLVPGAVVASVIGEVTEGNPPSTVRGEAACQGTEYLMVSGKAYTHETIRSEDPAHLSFRPHMFGGWALVPTERLGETVSILTSRLREFVGETLFSIQVTPMSHAEIARLWPSGGE